MRSIYARLPLAVAIACLLPFAAGARDRGDIDKVNGGIHIASGDQAGHVETVNGGITIDDNGSVRRAETVNGGVHMGDNAHADSVETVNGGVRLGAGATVTDDVETVNGGITLEPGAQVGGKVENVNGAVQLTRAHVGGQITTVSGDVNVGESSSVDGGIHFEKPSGMNWSWSKPRPPRLVIGPNAVVRGEIRIDRDDVVVFVHDSAKIASIRGATAQKYSGDKPPARED